MRVLFLNHNTVGYGTYYRCLFLGLYLTKLGNEVTMICSSNKNFDLRIIRKKINEKMFLIILPRIKVSQYHTAHSLRGLINTLYTLSLNFDIIHSFVFPTPPVAIPTVLAKFLGRKTIVVDGDDLWRGGWAEYHSSFTKFFLEKAEDKIPLIADGITIVSEAMKNRFLELGINRNKIYKIPNGANVEEIRPMDMQFARRELNLKNEKNLLVTVGHTYVRNLFLLFDTFKRVLSLLPNTKLIMVGKLALSKETWQEMNKKYGELFNKQVMLIGEQPYEKLPYYLAAADALLLPMEDTPIEKARWPIRLGDYLAAGKPIISNAVGEVKNVIEDNRCGLTSHPAAIDDFAENIAAVLQNRDLAVEYGKRARRVAEEKYSWSGIAKNLELAYQEILNS